MCIYLLEKCVVELSNTVKIAIIKIPQQWQKYTQSFCKNGYVDVRAYVKLKALCFSIYIYLSEHFIYYCLHFRCWQNFQGVESLIITIIS